MSILTSPQQRLHWRTHAQQVIRRIEDLRLELDAALQAPHVAAAHLVLLAEVDVDLENSQRLVLAAARRIDTLP